MKEKPIFDSVVAETLLIPLYMRACESRRSDALLHDPLAEELTASIDYDYAKYDRAWMSRLGCVVRGRYYDDCVQAFIRRRERPVVVNVGCGLDTRFQRIADRRDAIFYEMDLPEVMTLRKRLIPAPDGDIYLAGSLLETEWMDGLAERHPDASFVFVFEGVLMYFRPEQVQAVLRNLCDRFPGGEVYFDVCGTAMVRTSLKPDSLRGHAAQIRWGISDGREAERMEPRLQLIEQRSYMSFARRRWGLTGLFFRLFPRLAFRFSSLLCYHISERGVIKAAENETDFGK